MRKTFNVDTFKIITWICIPGYLIKFPEWILYILLVKRSCEISPANNILGIISKS